MWIRRVNFQIHLWLGVILGLYVALMGVTGSILVFGAELDRLLDPRPWPELNGRERIADISVVIDRLRMSYPAMHIVSVTTPTADEPVFRAVLQSQKRIVVVCHPQTGQVLGEVQRKSSRLAWIYDLHENLFAKRTGRQANGIGAALLLLLAVTGLFNWWPGVQNLRRALAVDVRRGWRRINFDLHSAVGFWSCIFVTVWAVSGVYFAWPDKVRSVIGRYSPILNSRPPAVAVSPESEMVRLNFHSMVAKAQSLEEGAKWTSVIFPSSRRSPLEITLARAPGFGRDYEDTAYFNPYNGEYITMWQYGVNRTLSDWFIWLQIPLHFGTHWGFAVKCLWAILGLSLPLLTITGFLMYWNRALRKKWTQLRGASASGTI